MFSSEIPLLVGWREWARIPDLNVPLIKVKIDTGAKTSALHAFDVEIVKGLNQKQFVEFTVHPLQMNDRIVRKCRAEIVDIRTIKSSNGLTEDRPVIRSYIQLGARVWSIDITLTNRDIMRHRMLLGREAMENVLVDPSKAFYQGVISSKKAMLTYEPVILT